MPEKKAILYISILIFLVVTIPYLYAIQVSNDELVFGGFLINPVDGNSYLAKMQQGYRGSWKFVLPYSAVQGDGGYLFLFYLVLGHLARLLEIPLILMFHISRLVFGGFLMGMIWLLFKNLFENQKDRIFGYSLSIAGSGLGWIAVLFGKFTSDFWVAEAYPFLSMYTNPHFSFGLGLMILALIPLKKIPNLNYSILGLILGVVQPFAVVILCLILIAATFAELYKTPGGIQYKISKSETFKKLFYIGLGGGSILVYQYWMISTDAVLSLWNDQNITDSPGLIDLLISFSPCFILAFFGVKQALKNQVGKILVLWTIISLLLILIPWNLQRRFLTGLFLPLVGLSVYGLNTITNSVRINRTGRIILVCLVIPTNLLVVFSGINATTIRDPQIFIKSSVISATTWIENNTESSALFLSGEEEGLLIPARTGRRVIYGHPFETTNALKEKLFVENFYKGNLSKSEIQQELIRREIDYVFSFRKNNYINDMLIELKYSPVYDNGDALIYNIE